MSRESFMHFAAGALKTSTLLQNLQPAKKKAATCDPLVQNFLEVLAFVKANGREPSIEGDVNERKLASQLAAFRAREAIRVRVAAYDDIGLLEGTKPEQAGRAAEAGVVKRFADLFKADRLGLLKGGDASIFELQHVRDRTQEAFRNLPQDIASRKPCRDFARFEKTFADIQREITAKEADLLRFKNETQVYVGDFFVLNGLLCYVAEVLDEREETVKRSAKVRANPRYRVIFENGVEVDILKRSLARALYKDAHGRMVIPSGKDRPLLVPESDKPMTETGCVYILSSGTTAPALAEMKRRGMLHKIGFSTQNVEERIRGAQNDPTYLEAPVKIEANIRCYNLDPRKMESLIHAFLVNQRINMTLYTRSGKPYVPREWYNVDLATALEVARRIADGTIMNYRMDNTTQTIKPV